MKGKIHRQAFEFLQEWRNSDSRKPLILRGARQVGKTTLVKHFAETYAVFIHLNLEKREDRNLFEMTDNVNQLIANIFVREGVRQDAKNVLLFIDEIQNSKPAVAMLRYFYEERYDLHVIAAGSLLETVMDVRRISFPVGRVQFMSLKPCSFVEFLDGMDLVQEKEFVEQVDVPWVIHERVMRHFREYTIVGGMPDAVTQYAATHDHQAISTVYESLLQTYKDDVEKYSSSATIIRTIRSILNVGWNSAAEIISFEGFGETAYRSREMSEAFQIISKAMLLELVYPTSETRLPIAPNYRRRPKLLWLDTGLVNYAAGVQKDVFLADDIQDIWRGRIAEHVVGQELIANRTEVSAHRSFWHRDKQGASAEVDFIYPYQGLLVPVEVKSGHNAHLKSLHLFMNEAPHNIAVRVWSKPFSRDEVKTSHGKTFKLLNVPFYYVGQLEKILQKEI
ncbi:MAG: ATP-binding protein [Bacteroidales bacterium]|nr:ATP-binding protein [Bacteroidales bacterium]